MKHRAPSSRGSFLFVCLRVRAARRSTSRQTNNPPEPRRKRVSAGRCCIQHAVLTRCEICYRKRMMRFVSASPRETQRYAKKLLRRFAARPIRPLIFALAGELGSGKTTFIQGLASSLGIRGHVQSPTFVLVRTHPIPKQFHQLHRFIHIDAYRLGSLAEARRLDLKQLVRERDAIVAVEWADRIRKLIPQSAYWIKFQHGERRSQRIIHMKHEARSKGHGSARRRPAHAS